MSDPFVSVGVVEALVEALENRWEKFGKDRCDCGQVLCGERSLNLAADVAAAVRSMSVQQQAELIGGTVEQASIGYLCERLTTPWMRLP